MDNHIKKAINRIQQLQQAFSEKLTFRVEELHQVFFKLDELSPSSADNNKQELKSCHDLAHKLAGSAGTFQFTDVYNAAINLEQFCAQLLDKNTPEPQNWFSQVHLLLKILKDASKYKSQVASQKITTIKPTPAYSQLNKIILVDDDELLSALIQEQAKHFGYNIECISNPETLSDFLDEHTAEVILMDIVFPNFSFDGIDLVKQLKAENKLQCPVVFLSNRDDFSARVEAVRSGGDGYIVKPINILELVEILDKHTHKSTHDHYRALIIDDDPIVADTYSKTLEKHQFNCKTVTNPFFAFEELESFLPDIILLDIHMPNCNGFEVADVIRQDNRFTHIPILFLSGDTNEEFEIAALKAGGNCLLNKYADRKTFVINAISQSKRSRELHTVINRFRKDELCLQAVSHSTSDAIITLNKDGLIILWNEGAENIFGYQSLEVIGQSIEIIIPKEYQAQHRKGFHNLVSKQNPPIKNTIESQAMTKEGGRVSIELTYSEWLSGNERFFTSIIRDVTKRKEIENKLHNQQENLTAIVNNSAEGIITINDTGIIEMVNPKALEIFGYSSDELKGQNFSILMPKSTSKHHDQYLQKFEIHNLKVFNKARELQGVRKDGLIFPMELNISPMSINGVKKYVGILHDISDRHEVLNALTLAKFEAEEANKAKSSFLSSMSHELRTPLNAVLGFTQLLQEDQNASLNEDQYDSLEHIYSAGHHLLNLIDEVLDLSKIENGSINVNLESINLIKLLNSSLELITPELVRSQISLEQNLPTEDNIYVMADNVRLNQVLANLLTNAIKYNKEQGTITVYLTTTSKKVRIHIKDMGLGIPEDMMDDLFTPFNRLGAAQSGIEGTGIGLTITKMLVELMGGQIGVDNTPGKGCNFWVELDKTECSKNSIKVQLVQNTKQIKNTSAINILYIEDNTANRLLIKKIIQSQTDFQYNEASNGSEGLEKARKIQPQVILLDISLPDMDGFEVYKHLQDNSLTKSTKVIVVSANAMPNDIAKGQSANFFAYLTKPIDHLQLIETINRALE